MLKPGMIRSRSFNTVKNGYDPDEVDNFLSEVADLVSELSSDNSEKDEKIATLVEKVNQYRSDEEAITTALISAQKESARVISEAEAKAEEMINSAKTEQVRITEQNAEECDRIIREHKEKCAELIKENTDATQAKVLAIRRAFNEEKEALDKLKAEVTYFKSDLTELYKKQLLLIMDIPEISNEELEQYEQEELEKARLAAEAEQEKENEEVVEEEYSEEEDTQERIDELLHTGSFEPVIPKNSHNDLKFGKNN